MDGSTWLKWRDVLTTIPIYPLIKPDLEKGQIMVHTAAANSYISHAADEEYHILYLLKGVIKVWSLSCRGRQVLLDEVHPMAFSGHISRLQGYSFDSSLIAYTDCVYLKFTDEQFTRLMNNPVFALEFYRSTSQRAYYMFHKFLGLSLFTAEENTAMYCVVHPDRLSKYTLDQISEEIGISRRSLCYIFKRWQQQGILVQKNRAYSIADSNALYQLTQEIRFFYHYDP